MTTIGGLTIYWPALIGQVLGMILGARLFSWLFVWIVHRLWRSGDGVTKLVVGYVITAIFGVVAGAFGAADGGSLNWTYGLVYIVPLLAFFLIDRRHMRRAQARAVKQELGPS